MTDMLHKPNGWDDPLNQMTEDEWQEYFRLREEMDVEYSEEELDILLDQINDAMNNKDFDKADNLMEFLPLEPHFAYGIKLGKGLQSLKDCNLSLAKKEYPDEF